MKKILILLAAITTTFLTAGYSNTISASAAECDSQVVNGENTTQCDINSFSDICNSNQIQQFINANGCDITNIATNYDCNSILDAIKNNLSTVQSANGTNCDTTDNSDCNLVQGATSEDCNPAVAGVQTDCDPVETQAVTEATTQEIAPVTEATTQQAVPEVAKPDAMVEEENVALDANALVNGCTSIEEILQQSQCIPFSDIALKSICDNVLNAQNFENCAKLPFCTYETSEETQTEVTTTQTPEETTQATTTQSTTTQATTTQAPPVVETPAPEAPESDYASEVVRLVNIERANYGLSPLTMTQNLNNAATVRANEIVTSFSHTRPNGTSCFTVLSELGISYNACGENIAAGQRTPEEVVTAWMNSEGHRANILNSSFNKIGVGVVESSSGYGIYWSQMFTN